MTAVGDPRDKFLELIDLRNSRVLLAPHITFVCGGPVDIRAVNNHSIRNMFMNLSARMPDKSEGFTLAENFKDWQAGYSNLSEFENDIASLSSIIVIILESAGALAELGLFFANPKLREKMVVVVHSAHHNSESFIKFGLLSPLEASRNESVLVYEIDSSDIEKIENNEIEEILKDVWDISDKIDKTSAFDTHDHGHTIFLIFQIIDLFTILTSAEIADFLQKLDIKMSKKQVQSALYILQKFKLVTGEKRSSQTFYFVTPNLSDRVELSFKRDFSDPDNPRRYDSRAIKLEVLDFYQRQMTANQSFNRRLNLWKRRMGGEG
ncbi:retron St85 family effector protein [Roseovarius sp.]|uniref:retron St85 family effector protein n=1 Tax=Roseovarius sp. TaxID=1486281 RepID=UPI003A987DBE